MPLPGVNKSSCILAENETRFTRTEQLIGKTALKKLQAAKVAVFGLGGVGSYVLETLARSGVGSFVLIDIFHFAFQKQGNFFYILTVFFCTYLTAAGSLASSDVEIKARSIPFF